MKKDFAYKDWLARLNEADKPPRGQCLRIREKEKVLQEKDKEKRLKIKKDFLNW